MQQFGEQYGMIVSDYGKVGYNYVTSTPLVRHLYGACSSFSGKTKVKYGY